MPATLARIMFTRSTTLVCLAALSIVSCVGERTTAARSRTPQLSLDERDEQMEREQVHAATFAVGDPVRIRDTDARTYLRGQKGKILTIERRFTFQHNIDEHETGRDIPAPVGRFQIVLDDRGVKCWAAPMDIEHWVK